MILTRQDRQEATNEINDRLDAMKEQILLDVGRRLVGRKTTITRNVGDADGNRTDVKLEATITGLEWTWDDMVSLNVEFIHPYSGVTRQTTEIL
jgi:hypothetical protein